MADNPDADGGKVPSIGDFAGLGSIINSKVASQVYDDALSPGMKEIGGITEDTVKSLRLFTAPLQLLATVQDRLKKFCQRVRDKVPEERQQEAAPEIALPVMEAVAKTSDASPLMGMFEELMAKAIDKNEAQKLSPDFAGIIQSLSPLEAALLSALAKGDQQ